jgi:2-polyprenyl-3-methyl-5-hydroxy-6-metoxy-1,4-benzoquinol methylase
MSQDNTVAQVWGDIAARRDSLPPMLGWLDSPLVQRLYVQPRTCGSPEGNWLISLVESLGISRDGRWLSIACGSGGLERFAAEHGLCASIEGVDIAPQAIELAQRTAQEQGLDNAQFRVLDLETARLPPDHYDVILCGMGLHHVRRLEFFYEEAMQTLRPGGWLLLNEFVGPSQWQWTDTQLNAVNTLLAALPERYRVHAISGEPKTRVERPTIAHMNAVDASESIRSAELLPLLREHFEIVEQRDYGGAMLHLLLEFIVGNFHPDDAQAVELLHLLFACEQTLMQGGVLNSDFAVAAARNQRASLRRNVLPLNAERERYIVSGAHDIEQADSARPFFWTEPQAELVLQRPANARTLHLLLMLPLVERTLTISVDDVIVGAVRATGRQPRTPWQHLTFGLPPTTTRQPTIRLELDQPWTPADTLNSQDTRQLGVALAHLSCR